MGTAVLEAVERAGRIAGDDHRHLADERRPVRARLGDVGLEAHVVPHRSLEDAAQLVPVVGLVLVDPVGDTGQGVAGPGALGVESAHVGPPPGRCARSLGAARARAAQPFRISSAMRLTAAASTCPLWVFMTSPTRRPTCLGSERPSAATRSATMARTAA